MIRLYDGRGNFIKEAYFENKEECRILFNIWSNISMEGDYVQVRVFTTIHKEKKSLKDFPRKRIPTENKSIYNTKNSLYE